MSLIDRFNSVYEGFEAQANIFPHKRYRAEIYIRNLNDDIMNSNPRDQVRLREIAEDYEKKLHALDSIILEEEPKTTGEEYEI